jgi:DNA-binding response OmpR family regulator
MSQSDTPEAPGLEESRRRPRVLLVDDSVDDLAMYGEYLRMQGYDVMVATDGAQGVDMALNQHFDIAVIDIAMPKLDGIGLMMVLRNYARTKNMPMVSLSARSGPEIRTAALDAGANIALEKPYAPEELAAVIQGLLDKAGAPQSGRTGGTEAGGL